MKGKNEIRLNLATVQTMLQYYFNEVLFQGSQVEIDSVTFNQNGYDNTLVVTTKEPEPTKALKSVA